MSNVFHIISLSGMYITIFSLLYLCFKFILNKIKLINNKCIKNYIYIDDVISILLSLLIISKYLTFTTPYV